VELLRDREGRGWRVLGITWLVIMTCMLTMHGRLYYPAPGYPMLFAAGGVAFERWFMGWRAAAWLKPAWLALLVITGVLIAPFAYFPILTVDQYIAYSNFLHFGPPKIENHRLGPLPQIYADQFGWKEMAQVVADAYHKLPREEQESCAIFGQNYGQAGAIDFFGAKMGLPPAISGHQNYFYWGPREYSGECMIVMADRPERLPPCVLVDDVVQHRRLDHGLHGPDASGHDRLHDVRRLESALTRVDVRVFLVTIRIPSRSI
jgi:hypothetical protein